MSERVGLRSGARGRAHVIPVSFRIFNPKIINQAGPACCRGFNVLVFFMLLAGSCASAMEFVRVADDQRHFVLADSGKPFIPWGHNYAVNEPDPPAPVDWDKVARDFDDFRQMGANVARIHLQVPHFMAGPETPNPQALAELAHWLTLAEQKGVYLDLTGLASYHIEHRAAWYDKLSDQKRWAVQARFWRAIATVCARSPAVFCYDLMNEPIATGQPKDGWYTGRMGDYEFLQRLSLQPKGRSLDQITKAWTHLMVSAIHKQDRRHLLTVGMLPMWGISQQVAGRQLDFIAVHIYPETGKVDEALQTLKRFDIGKPIVVEETFPLRCDAAEEREFLLRSRALARGWLGQYPSEGLGELLALEKAGNLSVVQSLYLSWLNLFRGLTPQMLQPAPGP